MHITPVIAGLFAAGCMVALAGTRRIG